MTSGKVKNIKRSALQLNEGVKRPPSVNKEAYSFTRQKRKKLLPANDYVEGIISQNKIILSQAITIIESNHASHKKIAREIIEACIPYSGNSIRIGITGVPGVGKSSFIEALGTQITSSGRKLAVLTIDPSSKKSGGSILGDKTRMEKLSTDPQAFIRPTPSSGTLGGVAGKTRDTITLCEAAGFDTIFIETVGVGQSETVVHSMVDFFLLLMLAGSGDELQGIKRGIMEMADALVITKADGDNIKRALQAQTKFTNALHFFPPAESGWTPIVLKCSALSGTGLTDIWETITNYIKLAKQNSWFQQNRDHQSAYWLNQTIEESIKHYFYNDPFIKKELVKWKKQVLSGKTSSFIAANKILEKYFKLKD